MVSGFEPRVWLYADSSEPGASFVFCVSLSLCAAPAHTLSLSLSKINIKKKFFFNYKKDPLPLFISSQYQLLRINGLTFSGSDTIKRLQPPLPLQALEPGEVRHSISQPPLQVASHVNDT